MNPEPTTRAEAIEKAIADYVAPAPTVEVAVAAKLVKGRVVVQAVALVGSERREVIILASPALVAELEAIRDAAANEWAKVESAQHKADYFGKRLPEILEQFPEDKGAARATPR